LVGSYAYGEARSDSDIDLLVITQDVESAERVKNSIDALQSDSPGNSIDCKVYTEKGFAAAKSGKEHLFLWAALSKGELLCGEDIRDGIKLNPTLITESIWHLIDELSSCRDSLKNRSQFTGCCYYIYYSLVTSYFLDRFILQFNHNCQPKVDFMRERLLNTYDIIKDRYQWVIDHVTNPEVSCTIKIPKATDRKFSEKQYLEILNICKSTLEYLQNVYSRTTKWRKQLL
jgi:hypothetical protein